MILVLLHGMIPNFQKEHEVASYYSWLAVISCSNSTYNTGPPGSF